MKSTPIMPDNDDLFVEKFRKELPSPEEGAGFDVEKFYRLAKRIAPIIRRYEEEHPV